MLTAPPAVPPPWGPAASMALVVIGYLWGSVLPAEWISRRMTGKALQDIGENPGASATWRVLGARAGLSVVVFDLLKGAIPFLAAVWLQLAGVWLVLPSLAPVIGHNWPLGRWRRGGHGLGPGGGVILSAGWPVMVYSALLAALPAAFLFRSRWGVALAAIGVPLGVAWMVRAGYRPDVIAVVVAVTAVLAFRLATAKRTTQPPAA